MSHASSTGEDLGFIGLVPGPGGGYVDTEPAIAAAAAAESYFDLALDLFGEIGSETGEAEVLLKRGWLKRIQQVSARVL